MEPAPPRRRSAFTLIQLVIVITIISILAAMIAPMMLSEMENARKARGLTDAGTIAKSVARFRADTSYTDVSCLSTTTNLSVNSATLLTNCPGGATTIPLCSAVNAAGFICYGGPYLQVVPNDPWETPYQVSVNSISGSVTVRSAGLDAIFNDDDDIILMGQ